MESARVLGEDYVNEQAKKTQMAIQANSAEDLNGLEAVMGASDSATAKAQEEQARIEAESAWRRGASVGLCDGNA